MHSDAHTRNGAADAEEFMAVAAHDLRNPVAVVDLDVAEINDAVEMAIV